MSMDFWVPDAPGRPSLNVSNRNASLICGLLGIDVDEYEHHPKALRESCDVALLELNIDGSLDNGTRTETYGNVIDCGLRSGYFADRLAEIVRLCKSAESADCKVLLS